MMIKPALHDDDDLDIGREYTEQQQQQHHHDENADDEEMGGLDHHDEPIDDLVCDVIDLPSNNQLHLMSLISDGWKRIRNDDISDLEIIPSSVLFFLPSFHQSSSSSSLPTSPSMNERMSGSEVWNNITRLLGMLTLNPSSVDGGVGYDDDQMRIENMSMRDYYDYANYFCDLVVHNKHLIPDYSPSLLPVFQLAVTHYLDFLYEEDEVMAKDGLMQSNDEDEDDDDDNDTANLYPTRYHRYSQHKYTPSSPPSHHEEDTLITGQIESCVRQHYSTLHHFLSAVEYDFIPSYSYFTPLSPSPSSPSPFDYKSTYIHYINNSQTPHQSSSSSSPSSPSSPSSSVEAVLNHQRRMHDIEKK
jgi:hypothetical protein